MNGHETVAMTLLGHDSVDPDQEDHYGSTPLSIAARHYRTEIVKVLLATGQVTFDSRDCFRRTSLWWARRRGNTDTEEVLLDYAEKRGMPVCDNDEFIEVGPISNNNRTSRWCNICTLGIPEDEVFYECGVCNSGNFHTCSECYKIGGRCLKDDHELAQREDKEE
ncbi:hypothetical protein EDB81DRAFT_808987 [Dactylonectria macrodidyma]|uniref:Ankyrin repeat protein n=1 Tax=Dactylonectria macrodidyma TaxID=307937 RepID=A0A9P9DY99_9HYPO|nr:hypothetical protein EDB81DRAFT_808987 [Dactylonectria macrodidyma]